MGKQKFGNISKMLAILLVVFFEISMTAVAISATTDISADNVSVIDTATNNVTATVNVGYYPIGVAVNPMGTRIYVTNLGDVTNPGSKNFSVNVSVIDAATNNVTNTVSVGIIPWGVEVNPILWGVAVSPDGTHVYVTNSFSNNISVIDTATNKVTAIVPVGVDPKGVAVSPDGTKVYVTNTDSSNVSIIDTSTNTVTATVPVGDTPNGVAITPDGTKAYVTNSGSNNISVIDTATNNVTGTVNVGKRSFGIAINPNGTKVYVANPANNTTSVIDTATNTVTATVTVGWDPFGVAVTPDGTKVYVTNLGDNTTSVIDTATNTVTAVVKVGKSPWGVAVNPAGTKVYVANLNFLKELPNPDFSASPTSGKAPLTVKFTDNSTGSTPTSWEWDFGDGSTNSTEQNPTHVYDKGGVYTVTLSTSNGAGSGYIGKYDAISVIDSAIAAIVDVGNTPRGVVVSPDGKKAYVANEGSNNISSN